MTEHLTIVNGAAAPIQAIPVLSWDDFSNWLQAEWHAGGRICSYFGMAQKAGVRITAVIARDGENTLAVVATDVDGSFPSLTPEIPALHLFERELFEDFGITPHGHPWLKPVRFPNATGPHVGEMPFFTVTGDDVHEVAVGPIHAGIIEPGHFRFQCLGETVMHLEISLGYQHRGIEKLCNNGPATHTHHCMETLAGDTTIGHTWAYCTLLESLADISPSPRGQALRAIALELERLANHTGDIGAIAGDIGYLPTSAFCGRLRGDYLNMTALICGNRFGRGIICPGGTAFDLDPAICRELATRLHATTRDTKGAADLLWSTDSVTARMMGIGGVCTETAMNIGLVGPAARASNIGKDARTSHPLPHLRRHDIALCKEPSGDVFARTRIRWREIKESATFIARMLENLPEGEIHTGAMQQAGQAEAYKKVEDSLAPLSFAVSLVEGWRGEICHAAFTDESGRICRYKVVDPSFHNWTGLALALRGQEIADFPLCNKSFNLSYCGHDL